MRNVSILAVFGLVSSPILLRTNAIIYQPNEHVNISCPGDIDHEDDITWSINNSIYNYRLTEMDGVRIVKHYTGSKSGDSVTVNFILVFNESKNGSILRCCYFSTGCSENLKSYKLLLKSSEKEGKYPCIIVPWL